MKSVKSHSNLSFEIRYLHIFLIALMNIKPSSVVEEITVGIACSVLIYLNQLSESSSRFSIQHKEQGIDVNQFPSKYNLLRF